MRSTVAPCGDLPRRSVADPEPDHDLVPDTRPSVEHKPPPPARPPTKVTRGASAAIGSGARGAATERGAGHMAGL
jgi:hypothetical protein